MLIIAGHLLTDPRDRDAFVAEGTTVVSMARAAPGCLDFCLTADTVDPGRVNVFERWESEEALLAFRGSGPDSGTAARIVGADVRRYGVASVGEP
ncbi:antibiotic biosynthesis monooxygenase [Pseudonocardia sp. C8]|uniref:putative quinol monooxygenase n=1 Tax=Pseudonocardia sp. C8 TaxID=2762759 RepID=UPI0016435944|nr:antibiotic biosynthesis monooxygenase family protein [Pseudonocardia sp. C8]MBC3192217.1 antibiotic biosynthesis monooxygenase [Pseudonocardia sp. C8]